MNDLILPDSRLKNPKATVMADWPRCDGTTIRLELEPVYCFACGDPNGYVPTEIISWCSWLCQKCSEEYGALVANWETSDHEFWAKVASEMEARFGHVLSQRELEILAERGELGRNLELLELESPYRNSIPASAPAKDDLRRGFGLS